MGRSFGFIALVVVVGAGAYIYMHQAQSLSGVAGNPLTAVDVTGVRNDLMAMAGAERRYFATNSKYATLDDLRTNGDIHIPSRENYSYSAQTSDVGFKIIAVYSGPDSKAPKRIVIDETMSMTTE
jgi:hypothetical protein